LSMKMNHLLRGIIAIFVTWLASSGIILGLASSVYAERYNMSYLYFDPKQFDNHIDATKGTLHTVSPSFFDLQADGSLKLNSIDRNWVRSIHERGMRVVPFLSNHWNRDLGIKALEQQERLVQQIVDAIKTYKLDGVNVDIENLTEKERGAYVSLVQKLREGLPANIEVSVAVAANPTGTNQGWQGSYDYAKLAEASDYLMLMTYDEGYFGGPRAPVAGIDFVEDSIRYALQYASPEKLVLGIPFYGRYWNSNENIGGRAIPLMQIEELTQKYKGRYHYDENRQSPYVTFTIPPGETSSQVYGRTLKPGNYTVWYENDRSIKNKLRLVEKYGLKGSGSWSLTGADPETWSYYSKWLNGEHYFVDTEGHWAEKEILSMLGKGWMQGTTEYDFTPNRSLTRAEATVILIRALGWEIDKSLKPSFMDLTGHWASEEITIASQKGLVQGIGKSRFAPNAQISRSEMAVLLSRAYKFGESSSTSNVASSITYRDVDSKHWAWKDISSLAQIGIFKGSEEGAFRPSDFVTRAEMAVLLHRIHTDIN
jgi:spore germination protein YaaH